MHVPRALFSQKILPARILFNNVFRPNDFRDEIKKIVPQVCTFCHARVFCSLVRARNTSDNNIIQSSMTRNNSIYKYDGKRTKDLRAAQNRRPHDIARVRNAFALCRRVWRVKKYKTKRSDSDSDRNEKRHCAILIGLRGQRQ